MFLRFHQNVRLDVLINFVLIKKKCIMILPLRFLIKSASNQLCALLFSSLSLYLLLLSLTMFSFSSSSRIVNCNTKKIRLDQRITSKKQRVLRHKNFNTGYSFDQGLGTAVMMLYKTFPLTPLSASCHIYLLRPALDIFICI